MTYVVWFLSFTIKIDICYCIEWWKYLQEQEGLKIFRQNLAILPIVPSKMLHTGEVSAGGLFLQNQTTYYFVKIGRRNLLQDQKLGFFSFIIVYVFRLWDKVFYIWTFWFENFIFLTIIFSLKVFWATINVFRFFVRYSISNKN